MFQCFETSDMGSGIFTCFKLFRNMFQFVLKRFETIESQLSIYEIYFSIFPYMFQCFNLFRNMGKRGDFVDLLEICLYHSL